MSMADIGRLKPLAWSAWMHLHAKLFKHYELKKAFLEAGVEILGRNAMNTKRLREFKMAVLSRKELLPLLMGIDPDLDKDIEKCLKNRN